MSRTSRAQTRWRRRTLTIGAAATLIGMVALVGPTPPVHAEPSCDLEDVNPLCGGPNIGDGPTGALLGVHRRPGGISVGGWARDEDVPSGPITIRITVNNQTAGTVAADSIRPDGALDFHGFVPTSATGPVTVRAWAQDDVGTAESDLGYKQITMSSEPIGYFDDVQSGAWSVWIRGWAIDPDVATPISVHVYQDGSFVKAATADSTRNDVGAAYPGYGADHGFDITVPHPANGQHTICVYAINTGAGSGNNPLLGCQNYTEVHSPPATPTQLTLATWQTAADGPYSGRLWFMDNSTDETNFRVYVIGGIYTSATDIGSVQGDVSTGAKGIDVPGNVAPLTQYCFWVHAYTQFNNSVTYGCQTTPRLPPLTPQNLAPASKTETNISLQWDDRATDEDGFDVKYWKPVGRYLPMHASAPAHPGTGRTSFTLPGLEPATKYCVQVSSAYQQLRSWDSNVACETTATPAPPAAPTNLKATPASQTSLDLSWTDNATNETGYRIERQDNGTWVTRSTKGAGATMHTDTGLAKGTTYCYRIVAVNAGGETPSATACGTTASLAGVKTAKIWNCASSELSGSLYMFDHTTGAGWTKVAPLPSSWVSTRVGKSCGPAVTQQPAASVNLPDKHVVTLTAVIVDGYWCTTEDPTTTKCRPWDLTVTGDANGVTQAFMF